MTIFILLLVAVVAAVIWLIGLYNNLVELRNNRENAFQNIDVQLKLRHDVIPNLVETVKGYATHERETLQQVIEARNIAVNARTIDDKVKAESTLGNLLGALRVTIERYPELKANENFMELQKELSDIEHKLAAVRRFFNSATREYNNAVERFPGCLIASRFGFTKETMFDVGEEERKQLDKAPVVKF